LKRKSVIFCPIEAFLELHSIAMERKKDVEWAKKGDFLANWKKFKPLRGVKGYSIVQDAHAICFK
jgi:hypothetical protein